MAQQPPHYPQAPQAPPPQQKKGTSTCLIVGLVIAAVSVPVLGVMAALGIYGVRRYLAAAKTAEAKNTVAAIARAAQAAYEREDPVSGKHRLCASARPVPAAVPAAKKYMPSSAPGADFQAGSPSVGWPCLKFSMSAPSYYQYHYQQGSGWVAPAAGAAGPNGFEAAAVGDLDGDGTKSLFSRTGTVSGGSVKVATKLYIENELE
jgi:type IV pilus assembly protein PilA